MRRANSASVFGLKVIRIAADCFLLNSHPCDHSLASLTLTLTLSRHCCVFVVDFSPILFGGKGGSFLFIKKFAIAVTCMPSVSLYVDPAQLPRDVGPEQVKALVIKGSDNISSVRCGGSPCANTEVSIARSASPCGALLPQAEIKSITFSGGLLTSDCALTLHIRGLPGDLTAHVALKPRDLQALYRLAQTDQSAVSASAATDKELPRAYLRSCLFVGEWLDYREYQAARDATPQMAFISCGKGLLKDLPAQNLPRADACLRMDAGSATCGDRKRRREEEEGGDLTFNSKGLGASLTILNACQSRTRALAEQLRHGHCLLNAPYSALVVSAAESLFPATNAMHAAQPDLVAKERRRGESSQCGGGAPRYCSTMDVYTQSVCQSAAAAAPLAKAHQVHTVLCGDAALGAVLHSLAAYQGLINKGIPPPPPTSFPANAKLLEELDALRDANPLIALIEGERAPSRAPSAALPHIEKLCVEHGGDWDAVGRVMGMSAREVVEVIAQSAVPTTNAKGLRALLALLVSLSPSLADDKSDVECDPLISPFQILTEKVRQCDELIALCARVQRSRQVGAEITSSLSNLGTGK